MTSKTRFTLTELLKMFSITAHFAGSVLLYITGISKIWSTGPSYFFGLGFVERNVVVGLGIVEVLLGLMLFVFANSRISRTISLTVYLTFVLIVCTKFYQGASSCDCIPGFSTPLLFMLAIDSFVLIGVAIELFLNCQWQWSSFRWLRGLYLALGIMALGLSFQYRSAEQAFQALSGKAVTADQTKKVVLAKTDVITVNFVLTNNSAAERKIIGAKSSCGCTSLEGLPVVVAAKDNFVAKMTIRGVGSIAPKGAGEFVSFLYCDDGTPVKIQATVVGFGIQASS